MKKAFVLSTCKTCQRILEEVDWPYEVQNIKEKNIDAKTLDKIVKEHGSYESLFSRRAMKYRSLGLNEKKLSEKEYRKYILEEYTFLKRPVFVLDNKSFVGNTKATVASLKNTLAND